MLSIREAAFIDELEKIARKSRVKSQFQKLKDNRVKLTPEERSEVMNRKAVWHFNGGGSSPAVWKSVDPKTGRVSYISNTHRAYQVRKSLPAAINIFHKFIKGTA